MMEFQFVNSSISCPTVPKSLEVRSMIRKQAMKKASAARKRNGNYGQHNLRQYPVFIVDQEYIKPEHAVELRDESTDSEAEYFQDMVVVEPEIRGRNGHLTDTNTSRASSTMSEPVPSSVSGSCPMKDFKWMEGTPAALSTWGCHAKKMQGDFDLLVLSTLAILHTGRAVRAAFSQNPLELIVQLTSQKRVTYLSFLPSRYEHSTCLRDATDCVIARVRRTATPDTISEPMVINIYLKALRSLQSALNCPEQRVLPEVLCATEILALYELLDPSGESAWIRHSAGAARLIRVRGPEQYTTEFEKSLLVAQSIAIVTEAVITGERCFLDSDSWRKTLQSLIEPNTLITDRSPIVIDLLILKCKVPNYFVDTIRIICATRKPSLEYIAKITSRVRKLRDDFLAWHARYKVLVSQVQDLEPGTPNHDSHCRTIAHYICSTVAANRMLAALSPLERKDVEEATQLMARTSLAMHEKAGGDSPTNVCMSLTTAISHTVLRTREDWCGDEGAVDAGRLIEKWKLERWCRLFGKKTPLLPDEE